MQQRDQWNIQYQKCGTTKSLHKNIYGEFFSTPKNHKYLYIAYINFLEPACYKG